MSSAAQEAGPVAGLRTRPTRSRTPRAGVATVAQVPQLTSRQWAIVGGVVAVIVVIIAAVALAGGGDDEPTERATTSTTTSTSTTSTTTPVEIGRAHVCTPVTNAHLVCRLMLEKKNNTEQHANIYQKREHE